MRNFYIEDKNTHRAYMGLAPCDERDCRPMDYYRYAYAHAHAEMLKYIATKKGESIVGDDKLWHIITLQQTDEFIQNMLKESRPNKKLLKLLEDLTLTKRKQEQLLRGLKMDGRDILWWNVMTHRLGYLMDIFMLKCCQINLTQNKNRQYVLKNQTKISFILVKRI